LSSRNDAIKRALVLGGGGVAGVAWMIGLLFGLKEAGVDLRTEADILIGTSAGATVAAQIASSTTLEELFSRQVEVEKQVKEIAPDPRGFELLVSAMPGLFKLADPVERTRKLGTLALTTITVAESVRRRVIAARLPSHEWPDRALKVVAVDIVTGEPMIFERGSGVGLVDAVAASCAVPGIWPPVSIGGRRYMDGGIRSSDNADLAAGCGMIFLLSPMGTSGMTHPGSHSLAHQIASLDQGGACVKLIEPDDAARQAIGLNPLSPDTRGPAAHAGRDQGRRVAAGLAAFIGGNCGGNEKYQPCIG